LILVLYVVQFSLIAKAEAIVVEKKVVKKITKKVAPDSKDKPKKERKCKGIVFYFIIVAFLLRVMFVYACACLRQFLCAMIDLNLTQ
jgi:hypothetical protein